jgi:hypothetical protein
MANLPDESSRLARLDGTFFTVATLTGRVPFVLASRRACVIIEKPAKTLPPTNTAATLHRARAIDQFVIKPLVIALTVVVLDELRNRLTF